MSKDNTVSEVTRALGVRAVLPAAYADLISPAARELGSGLATIAKAVRIALAPVEAMVWGYDRIREWLSIRVTSLLADRGASEIQAPPTSLAGPLVLQMFFSSQEPDLREMYAKLLATAMDASSANRAHPSFVSVVQQLTPGEARLLNRMALLEDRWPCWSGNAETTELTTATRQYCRDAGVEEPELADLYFENLLRLRLLQYSSGAEAEYHPAGANRFGDFGPSASTKQTEFIELTSYGRAFLDACARDPLAQQGCGPNEGSAVVPCP